MKIRLAVTLAVFGAFGFMLGAAAQDPPTPPVSPTKIRDDSVLKQQILARQFAQFEQDLFKLILKLKRSVKEDDRLRAEVLEKVLDRAKKDLVSVQFETIIQQLKEQQLKSTPEIKIAAERSEKLADDLRKLIELIREDPRTSKNREEQMRLKELIAELEKIIHRQKVAQGLTDGNRTDKIELAKIQNQVTKQTSNFRDKLDGKKSGEGAPKDGKGDPKAGKPGDPKTGAKPGDPKSAKAGDPKPGDPKPGDPKAASAGKAGDPKPGDPKSGEAKPGESSKGQGEPKEGSPSESAKKGDSQPKPPSPAQEASAGKKQVKDVEEAIQKQESSEENINKQKNPDASNDQQAAVDKLEAAKKKLEELLRQLREEELERTLTDLIRRCEKMLAMQVAVYNGTKGVDKAVADNSDKKPTRENKQDALKLSDQEGEIVVEAKKAIEVLEAEGSAVAFPEVFQQVREDMMHVQRRLAIADVGQVTQTIEQDIIDSLREMIEALKKAKQEMENKKSNPPPGPPPPPQDQKLLELIQELKLIRSMQIRVNTRTTTYGKLYQGEQTAVPEIRQELQGLSERQERIYDVTNRLAKGDNR